MGSEPSSLFLYGDNSVAARSVREAIYDGPFDIRNFDVSPVILSEVPSLANGDATLDAVDVGPGSMIIDASGKPAALEEGVSYLPSGCTEASCAQKFSGQDSVKMDQLSVRFRLRPNLQWSDGSALTADDSVYSFEIATSLYPMARPDLVARTQSYQAADETSVVWKGIPGFTDADYRTDFFTPLPRHLWGAIAPQDLLTTEISSRSPIGWGPYKIEEWTVGDHITLSKNPNYFRADEGLPYFDRLVFRFVESPEAALSALQAGECDYLDESLGMEKLAAQLSALQDKGSLALDVENGTSWDHADFEIVPLDSTSPALFQSKQTRQAIAMCIDRQKMASEIAFGQAQVLDTYASPEHPLFNPDARHYDFDPQAASDLLQSAGWVDDDGDPATPRLAQGVNGVPDGTPFEFSYLTATDDETQRAAQDLQASLAQCGVKVDLQPTPSNELLAPGPDGPVFGRNFSMAQFAWITSLDPPCFLYTSSEIPGPYPDFPRGWGGANVSGYSNPEFDQACRQALFSLPDSPEHTEAQRQAQAIFAEDLPAIPLYTRSKLVVTRPDMCGVLVDPSSGSALWNLETFNYGKDCGN